MSRTVQEISHSKVDNTPGRLPDSNFSFHSTCTVKTQESWRYSKRQNEFVDVNFNLRICLIT